MWVRLFFRRATPPLDQWGHPAVWEQEQQGIEVQGEASVLCLTKSNSVHIIECLLWLSRGVSSLIGPCGTCGWKKHITWRRNKVDTCHQIERSSCCIIGSISDAYDIIATVLNICEIWSCERSSIFSMTVKMLLLQPHSQKVLGWEEEEFLRCHIAKLWHAFWTCHGQ